MKNCGGHFAPKLGGHFELESGGHFKLELGGQYHWNLHTIMQHYVKKLWEKKYWHELRSVRVFVLCVGQALWLMVCRIFQFTYNFLAIRQSA